MWFSQTRDRNHVPCFGRLTPGPCKARENALVYIFLHFFITRIRSVFPPDNISFLHMHAISYTRDLLLINYLKLSYVQKKIFFFFYLSESKKYFHLVSMSRLTIFFFVSVIKFSVSILEIHSQTLLKTVWSFLGFAFRMFLFPGKIRAVVCVSSQLESRDPEGGEV